MLTQNDRMSLRHDVDGIVARVGGVDVDAFGRSVVQWQFKVPTVVGYNVTLACRDEPVVGRALSFNKIFDVIVG